VKISISNINLGDIDKVKLKFSPDFPDYLMSSIKSTFIENQINALVKNDKYEVVGDWHSLLNMLRGIQGKATRNNFKIEVKDNFSKVIIENLIKKNNKIKTKDQKKNKKVKPLSDSQINSQLKKAGFKPPYKLTKYQLASIKFLLQQDNGANFSVPGSGKTVVTLATHVLTKGVNGLLVVAPKNAFMAWDEQIDEIFEKSHPIRKKGIVRLIGTEKNIKKLLTSGHKYFLINYERLPRIITLLSNFLRSNKIHMVLDESHKIKSQNANRANAARILSIYPVRKDILTGTPMPNTEDDVKNQWDFLYQNLSFDIKRDFFTRTTKQQLNLPKLTRKFVPVKMSEGQLLLYARVMDPFTRLIKEKDMDIRSNFSKIKKSIMRLIQISSNPILVLRRMGENNEYYMGNEVDRKIVRQIENEVDSEKIKRACLEARKLAAKGEKSVIWTFFRGNVERIGKELLNDLGAEYIHGGVPTGDDEELGTREQKIKRFKDLDSNCMVLVANYAACAEGISLHKACHNAIYIDRTFQAELYLQSEDRIHRLGDQHTKKVLILETAVPRGYRSIDLAIRMNLEKKIRRMGNFLNDPHLRQMANDEYETNEPIDEDIDDVRNILKDFANAKIK